MKKITLLLVLLISYVGISQTAPIDFEAGGVGGDWTWTVFENEDNPPLEIVANPDPSGINTSATVAKFTARETGAPFAGVESQHGGPIGVFDLTAANSTVNIMVYKTKISDVGIKFATPSGGAQMEIKVANTLVNQWELITIDFSSYIGLPETTGLDQIIVFPDFVDRPADDIIYFDNISFGPFVPGSIGLPVDFELDASEYDFFTFNGTEAAIETNPDMTGENTSATVMRSTKTNGAAFFAGNAINLDVPIDFSTSEMISIKTWSPKPNIPIRFALENQNTGNQIVVDVNTTVTNAWETLTFDFTGLINPAVEYNRVVVFFEFIVDLPGDGSTYYFDDIEVVTPMSTAVELPVDFELPLDSYSFEGFEGADSAIETNPDMSGENTSSTAMRTTKTNGSAFFAGTLVNLDVPADFSESSVISMKTWSPKPNIPIRFALENQTTGNQIVVDVNTTVTNAWETLNFDFTGLINPAVEYNRVVVFFEFIVDLPGDGSTYYFDDIAVAAPTVSPVELPITFEAGQLPAFGDFNGSFTQVIPNPDPTGANTSATVAENNVPANAGFAGVNFPVDTEIDITTDKGFTMNVWSPVANTPVLLKLENATTGVNAERAVTTTTTDAWETLTFDFSEEGDLTFESVTIFMNFNVVDPANQTYYWDDLIQFEIIEEPDPVSLPITFEDGQLPVFGDFNGSFTQVIANPDPTGANTSATVAENTVPANAAFAGANFPVETLIDITTDKGFTMNVWSPVPNTPVLLKLENATTGVNAERAVTTTTTNAWETLTFDFSTEGDLTFESVTIFMNFNVVDPADQTYYWDDLVQFEIVEEGDPVVLPITFEDENVDYNPQGFEGADSAVEMNPDMSGENTSETVLRTTKTEGALFFAGTFINLGTPIDFSEFGMISMKTWSPKADIPVRMAIENITTGNQIFVDVNTTVENQWETLVFDFSEILDSAIDYNRVVVFFEFIEDLSGDGSTYYFDDVEVGEFMNVAESNQDSFRLFPNPAKDILFIEATDTIKNIVFVNVLGQQVMSQKGDTISESLDVTELAEGVYLVTVSLQNGNKQTIRFIKK